MSSVLSDDQLAAILSEIDSARSSAPLRRSLLLALSDITNRYKQAHDEAAVVASWPVAKWSEHRKNLKGLESALKRLDPHLRSEPLILDILCNGRLQAAFESGSSLGTLQDDFDRAAMFRDTLSILKVGVRILLENESYVRMLRSEDTNTSARKSLYVKHIWEPVFRIWLQTGHCLTRRSTPRIVNILNPIHRALGLDEVSVDSVESAIKDFKSGGRARSRGSAGSQHRA
jgi:hypothetical protein